MASRWSQRNPDFDTAFARSNWAGLVRFARDAYGLSQDGPADALECSQSAVSQLEDGRHPPTIRTLARVAAETGCELTITMRYRHEQQSVAFDGAAWRSRRSDRRRGEALAKEAAWLLERASRE